MNDMVGKKVKVTFDTTSWPVHHGTYIYEGHDEKGYWLRRSDGVQRHMLFGDVTEIRLAKTGENIEETPH